MDRLDGKVAIVTGAAQGIGAVYARALAERGAAVGVCDLRDPAPIVAEIVEAGGKAAGGIVDASAAVAVTAFVSDRGSLSGEQRRALRRTRTQAARATAADDRVIR